MTLVIFNVDNFVDISYRGETNTDNEIRINNYV